MPLEASVSRWGDEIFFPAAYEHAGQPLVTTLDVNIGDVCFYPSGKSLCIFFGRTPASVIDKPVPEGPVTVIGRNSSSLDPLKLVNQGDRISVSLYQEPQPTQPSPNPAPAPAAAAPAPAASLNPYGERKLSQTEIDELVKRLLAEKNNRK